MDQSKEIKCLTEYAKAGNLPLVKKWWRIDTDNDRALRLASKNGHLPVVKYLIEQGADIHTEDDYAFQMASKNGHLPVFKYLIEQGANIHAGEDGGLRWASAYGHLPVVKYLVEQGVDIHTDEDWSLRWATQNGHYHVVAYLFSKQKPNKARALRWHAKLMERIKRNDRVTQALPALADWLVRSQ